MQPVADSGATTRWSLSIDLPASARSGAAPSSGRSATHAIELRVVDGRPRISLDGRVVAHRDVDGRCVFSVRGQQVTVTPMGSAWELEHGGQVVWPSSIGGSEAPPPLLPTSGPAASPPSPGVPARFVPDSQPPSAPTVKPSTLIWLGFAGLVIFLSAGRGVVFARPAKWEPAWRDVRSSEGKFKTHLPGEQQTWAVDSQGGDARLDIVSSTIPAGFFGVAWRKGYPNLIVAGGASQECESAFRAFLGSLRGSIGAWLDLESQAKAAIARPGGVQVCDLAGRLHRSSVPSDLLHTADVYGAHVSFIARVVAVGDRQYIAMSVVAPQFATLPEVTGFVKSLRIDDLDPLDDEPPKPAAP